MNEDESMKPFDDPKEMTTNVQDDEDLLPVTEGDAFKATQTTKVREGIHKMYLRH